MKEKKEENPSEKAEKPRTNLCLDRPWFGNLFGPEMAHLTGLGVLNNQDLDVIIARRRNL